jgi:4'-phosphopantetheinyl transferase
VITQQLAEQGHATVMPFLEKHDCQVWWARPADAWRPLDRLLDRVERDRRDRLLRQDDRDRLTTGIALARLVLAHHVDCPTEPERLHFDRTCRVCGAQHGKPRLMDATTGLQFSIAHSGERIALAVVRGAPVGVDVEQLNPALQVDALAAEVLSAEERAKFATLPPQDRLEGLLTYWTRKEALLKATGDGLRAALATVTVSGPDELPRLKRWSDHSRSPRVALQGLHPGAGYVASLAVLELPTVTVLELDAEDLLAAASH